MPGGTYFLYVRAPKGCGDRSFPNAEEASQFLINEQSVICVPWDNAGAYLRFTATYLAKVEPDEDRLMAETARRLGRLQLRFRITRGPSSLECGDLSPLSFFGAFSARKRRQ